MFIMLDGIDGSGKSTIIDAWKEVLARDGKSFFDLKKYWQENNSYPDLDMVKPFDYVFSCEPTYLGIGKVIRKEFIKNNNEYPAIAIAEAYSLDRLVLYNKIIIPLLREGKNIIQDRGISTSLAYQTIENGRLSCAVVANLIGNKLALDYHPDHLVLLEIEPETAMNRLSSRIDKLDDSTFEKLDFLKKASAQFHSDTYQNVFSARGTRIHWLSAEDNIVIMREKAIDLFRETIRA